MIKKIKNENTETNSAKNQEILIQTIEDSNKTIKNLLNFLILFGSISFFIVGISSYLNLTIIPILDAKKIIFYPQGITMCFYGLFGTLLSLNQIKLSYFNIGNGYNEFNKKTGKITISRKTDIKKINNIHIQYPITDIVRNTILQKL